MGCHMGGYCQDRWLVRPFFLFHSGAIVCTKPLSRVTSPGELSSPHWEISNIKTKIQMILVFSGNSIMKMGEEVVVVMID